MSEKFKFHDPDALYFVTFTVVKWIPVLENDKMKLIVLDSLRYCQKEKGLIIHCWCIMTNHLHLIISRSNSKHLLSEIIRDFKKFTSKRIIDELVNESKKSKYLFFFNKEASKIKRNKDFKVWKDGSHPTLLDTNFLMDQKVDYIHYNPVKTGLSDCPEDYEWSSAKDYNLDKNGLLEISHIG